MRLELAGLKFTKLLLDCSDFGESSMSSDGNLWVSLLRESSKRSQIPEATCIVLGDKESGKRTLMETLCCSTCKTDNDDILSYNYFDVEEGTYEFTSKINLWSFGENIYDKSFEIIGSSNLQHKLSFIVVIDLSKPDECVPSLLKWLVKLSYYVQKMELSKQTKTNNLSYLKSARTNKGNLFVVPESAEGTHEDAKLEFIREFFCQPIIVVGTKCDLLRSNEGFSAKKAREIQGQLRSICLDIGAALIYTSNPQIVSTDASSPPSLLKEYLLHRIYPETLSLQHGIEDTIESTFIPAGFDTSDMIKNSSGLELLYDLRSKFAQLRATATENKTEDNEVAMVTSASDYQADVEHEQEWLSGLQNFINQVSAAGASTAPTPTPIVASGSMPTSKNPSETALNTLDTTDTASVASKEGEVDKKAIPKPTRRVSASAKPGDSKDATDFFKKMLESSNKK